MKILTLLSLLLLIGCDPLTPEQIAQKEAQIKASADFVSKKLPEGCNLGYAGELDIKSRNVPVVYVDCKGATTVNTLYSSGKSSYANAVVKIKQLNETIENALEEKQKLEKVLEKLSPEDKKILGIQ
jgi:hypothetical protein